MCVIRSFVDIHVSPINLDLSMITEYMVPTSRIQQRDRIGFESILLRRDADSQAQNENISV
jgi:hypothetical protein